MRVTGLPVVSVRIAGVLTCCLFAVLSTPLAAAPDASIPAAHPAAPGQVAEQGVHWREIRPAQQAALQPLEREWPNIPTPQKQKWLELSARFPTMSPSQQARVQERMAEWARLTPQERGNARLRFQEAKQLSAADRQARWAAYQALSPEEKQRFTERARQPGLLAGDSARRLPVAASGAGGPSSTNRDIGANPARVGGPRVIGPTVVQAQPGVSTTSITKRPTPPIHQQPGLPKIAATPGYVNKSTLLPQRGPQADAAHGPVLPSAPTPAR